MSGGLFEFPFWTAQRLAMIANATATSPATHHANKTGIHGDLRRGKCMRDLKLFNQIK